MSQEDKQGYGVITSVRLPPELKEEFKRKARQQGRTMSEVIKDMIRGYVGIQTDLDDLERKKQELADEKNQLDAKISEVENAIEEQKGTIPTKIGDYLTDPEGFENQTQEIQDKRIRQFSQKLDMEPEEFIESARREFDGFNGFGMGAE